MIVSWKTRWSGPNFVDLRLVDQPTTQAGTAKTTCKGYSLDTKHDNGVDMKAPCNVLREGKGGSGGAGVWDSIMEFLAWGNVNVSNSFGIVNAWGSHPEQSV